MFISGVVAKGAWRGWWVMRDAGDGADAGGTEALSMAACSAALASVSASRPLDWSSSMKLASCEGEVVIRFIQGSAWICPFLLLYGTAFEKLLV